MASNPIPRATDQLFTAGEDACDGANTHEADINLQQNKEAILRPILNAAQMAEEVYNSAKTAKIGFTTAQTVADSNVKAFLGKASQVLGNYLGSTWSQLWEATGFPNQSTAVPSKIEERQSLINTLKNYFTANPAHENMPLGVTAASAATLFTALSDARSALHECRNELGLKKADRDAKVKILRLRLRGLIDELATVMPPDDPRWYAFGFTPPAFPDTPPIVEGIVVSPAGPQAYLIDWPHTPNADRYHVFVQVVNIDPDFVLTATVQDSDYTLANLTSGAIVRVQLSAINSIDAEGPRSDTVEFVVA